jgi:hypothetical protein
MNDMQPRNGRGWSLDVPFWELGSIAHCDEEMNLSEAGKRSDQCPVANS